MMVPDPYTGPEKKEYVSSLKIRTHVWLALAYPSTTLLSDHDYGADAAD